MSFIGVKKVVRSDTAFLRFLHAEYHQFVEDYSLPLGPLPENASLATIDTLLRQLARVADTRQQRAISTILERYVSLGHA
jgi:hypothetical protein